MIYYVGQNAYEIINGGDGMVMVCGVIVHTLTEAKKVCHLVDAKKKEYARQKDGQLWYFQVAA